MPGVTKEEQYWRNQNVDYRPILEYKPLTQAEEQRLRTEYYTNNNRVGYDVFSVLVVPSEG